MLADQGKGGGLTGQAAVAALLEAVPTGKVRSDELLPFVSREMQRRAEPKLDIARETSQGWQGRLANQRTGWAMIASESGVEEGQRNFFRFFTQWMNENQQIPQRFGEMWKNLSEQFVIAGGFVGLFKEALGGEKNIIAEILGPDKMAKLIEDFTLLSNKVENVARFFGLFEPKEEAPSPGQAPKRGEAGFGEKSFWDFIAEEFAYSTRAFTSVTELDFFSSEGFFPTLGKSGANIMDYLTYNTSLGKPARNIAPRVEEWIRNPLIEQREAYGFAYGEDYREIPRSMEDIMGGMRYNSPSAATLAREAGMSFGQGETINVGGITIHATSSEPEAIREAVEEVFREGLPPKSR